MKNIDHLFKIPFVDGGRDYTGCDCWGFVRIAAKELFNIDLPLLPAKYHECKDFVEVNKMVEQHKNIMKKCNKKPGALIHIIAYGWACHLGIMISKDEFIHIEKGPGVNRQNINLPRWKGKILGYYELASN